MILDSAIHGSCVIIMIPRVSTVSQALFRKGGSVKEEIPSTNRLLILSSISSHFFSSLLILKLNGSMVFVISSGSPESLSMLWQTVCTQVRTGSLHSTGAAGGSGGLARGCAPGGGELRTLSIGRGDGLPRAGPRELSGTGVGGVPGDVGVPPGPEPGE